jgi:uncharacterized protein (TIGR04255 family)
MDMDQNVSHGALRGEKKRLVTATRPEFERPPLIEQVITVVFDALAGFGIGDIGRFWTEIEDQFPLCESAPPLDPAPELPPTDSGLEHEISVAAAAAPIRGIYKQAEGGEAVQVQPDRFVFNWTRFGEAPYPRSEATMDRFLQLYETFRTYIRRRQLGEIVVNQCELVNVNIIDMDAWGGHADAPMVFTMVETEPPLNCLHPESYTHSSTHAISGKGGEFKGRLHTSLQPVTRIADGVQAYRFELTARSSRLARGWPEATDFFNLARDSINATFMASTTAQAHEYWGEVK